MRNEKISATRLFSMLKHKNPSSTIIYTDNQNTKNKKEKVDNGEFLKRLFQNDEDENNDTSKVNHNAYSKPKMILLKDNNDSYRNNYFQELEKNKKKSSKKNKNIKQSEESYGKSKDGNEEEESEDNYMPHSEETNNIYPKKLNDKNNKTNLIRNKTAKMSLFKKIDNPYSLKNHTVFTKFSLGNITYDDKEFGSNIKSLANNLKKKSLATDVFALKEQERNSNFNLNFNQNLGKTTKRFSRYSTNTIDLKKNEKIEYLKIGDIVILINIITNDFNDINKDEEILFNDGIVYPEIIVSKQLFCLPLSKLNDSHRGKTLFKRSLFRIETPQNFVQQHQFEKLKKLYKNNNSDYSTLGVKEQAYLKILSRKALEEKKHNESEFLLNYNKKVLFGTIIQLRNIFTNQLLTIDFSFLSKEIGCLGVVLNSLGGEYSQFMFVPSNCLHNLGDPIFYNETFNIIPCALGNKHYIHIKDSEDVKGNGFEVNVSRNQSIFKLLLFESAEVNRKSSIKNELKSTMVVKLYNTDLKGFLSASICNINKVLPKLKTNQGNKNIPFIDNNSEENSNILSSNEEENEEEDDDFEENKIEKRSYISKNSAIYKKRRNEERRGSIFNNYIKRKKFDDNSSNKSDNENNVNQETYYKIILNTNNLNQDDCQDYWEIQYEKPYEGKIINSECPIRFRHISSGLYLSFDHHKKEISLKQNLNDDSVFYICNEDQEKNNKKLPIISGDQIYLRAKNTNMYLKIGESKIKNKTYTLSLQQEDKMKHESFAFKIELQNNPLIQINYNVNLIINHLINLYEQINYWGIKEVDGIDSNKVLIYDYYTALQNELHFKKMVELYQCILTFIKNESQKAINDINVFINFQNYHSDQGLIFLILNFILLFDSKLLINREEIKGTYVEAKEKATPDRIARKYIGDVIELSFNLLKMLIKKNEHTSKKIYNSLFLFDELLNNHQLDMIEIFVICLKNTFSENLDIIHSINYSTNYISHDEANENIKKYNVLTSTEYWIKKLEDIDEINKNIPEQTIYLKVLKRLCLNVDGFGILKNQMEITRDLYKNDYLPLKFGIDNNNNKPYTIFRVSDNNNDNFFRQNPSLNEIKIENNNNINTPMFYYTSFSDKFESVINYICAVLDLYYSSCASRNELNTHIMIDNKNVGLTKQHIFLVITDNNINVKIRKIYSRLYRVLFIDTSPNERISINRLKIFLWNSEPSEDEDILHHIYDWIIKDNKKESKPPKSGKNNQNLKTNDNFYILRYYYINNFFNDKDFLQNLIERNETVEGRFKFYKYLGFLEEILVLAKESLDFCNFNLNDLISLIQKINTFFIVFKFYRKKSDVLKNEIELYNYRYDNYIVLEKNNNQDEKMNENEIKKLVQNNWIAKLVYYCLKSKYPKIRNRLYQIYEKILDIYNIISIIKEDSEKYMLFKEFKKWYNSGDSLFNSTDMVQLNNNFVKWENSLQFCFDINKEKDKEKEYEILNDNYIFEVLFLGELTHEYNEYQLFNKAFSMMIDHLNHQFQITNELSKIEIIVNDDDIKIFESLIETNKFIKRKKQNIESAHIMKNNPIQNMLYYNKTNLIYESKIKNNKNKNIITIIDDLTNKIEADLIIKMKLKSNKKLKKIQNLCQVLEIHKTLINIMKFLLKYENETNLYHKIFQFLYHFCYKNYINRKLLKSNFDFFLSLMPRFNYIGEVLMEILALYRESKKSQKFITKIFERIKEFDLICPEIIEILISLMFNNKSKNLFENQILILQNFFDILKDNTFRELLEESKMIEYIDGIKSHAGDYRQIEKEFKSYLNIFEIISYTCVNNKYCIINCRLMLSIDEFVSILKSCNYPYKLKTFLLLFFKNVYYPLPTLKDIKIFDISYFFDILQNFILKELLLFYFYSVIFIERYLIKKGVEPNDEYIRGDPHCSKAYSIIISHIKDEPEIKDFLVLQKINLDSLENTKSLFRKNKYISKNKNEEYMNFFILIRQNQYFEEQGLIPFLHNMYIYIKENKIELKDDQKELILLTKKRLNQIEELLEQIENELMFDNFIADIEYHIKKCLDIFIYEDNDIIYDKNSINNKKLNESEIQKIEQNVQKCIACLNEYISSNDTNLTKIFDGEEDSNFNEVDRLQFRRTMKTIFNNKISMKEIDDAVKYLDKKEKGKIQLRDIYIYLNKNKKKNNIADKKGQNISEYLDVNSKLDDKSFKISFIFKQYLFSFYKIQKQIGSNNSFKSIIALLNSENNIGSLILFFSRILGYINKNENKKKKIYFLKLIHGIINDKIYDISEKNKQIKKERIEVTQLILCHSGIIEFILSNLYIDNNIEVLYECICVLNLCLGKGNKNVQNTIYNYVSYKNNTYKFLSCLEWMINESFNIIKLRNKSYIDNNLGIENFNNYDYEMFEYLNQDLKQNEAMVATLLSFERVINVLLSKHPSFYFRLPRLVLIFIQLCCENNENFQHFFRDSEYDKNIMNNNNNNENNKYKEMGSINLVNDIGSLLVNLLKLGVLIYYNNEIWKITREVFITLSYLCEGPCELNQILLGLRKTIYSSINLVLQNDYNLQIKDEINTRKNLLLCYSIKFIKSLISQNSLQSIGEILLEATDIYLLIEKLIDIYSLIIEPNEELLYNGEICHHTKKSNNRFKRSSVIIKTNPNLNECEDNKCKLNYISKNEMDFINAGFNIFIILIYLKDMFPDHQKLSLFNLNLDKSKHSQFLKVNQIKKRNYSKELQFGSNIQKKDFLDNYQNELFSGDYLSDLFDYEDNLVNNDFENETTRKTLDYTDYINSDTNLHEISIFEDNMCVKILKFLTCGFFRKNIKKVNKKNNKSFDTQMYQKNQKIFHMSENINSSGYLDQSKSEINNLKKRFISKYKARFNNTYIFYAKLTSNVEISIKNKKIKKYFKIPFKFINLTKELKSKIIYSWKSTFQQSSIREIFQNIEKIVQILDYKQKLRQYHLLFENIKPVEMLSYLVTFILNIILLSFITNNDIEECQNNKRYSCLYVNKTDDRKKYKYLYSNIHEIINGLIYLKLVLYIIITVLTILKKYKMITNKMINKADLLIEEYKENKMKKYEGSLLYHVLKEFNISAINTYYFILVSLYKVKGLNIIFDFDVIVLLINIVLSFLSIFITPFFQIFTLLEIIRLSSFLNNIVFILFKNIKKLFFMIYSLLIIYFLFSVFEFLYMRKYYYSTDYMNIQDNELNLYCDTIYYCFISILHYGINPNNILLIGGNINRSDSIFFVKLVIDLILYMIFFSLLISIFFGIIINSLKEFNEIMNEKQKSINERCFICGMSRYKLDREEKGWIYHYKREHNIFSYIYFLSELQNKKFDECDGVEKFVKNCIQKEELIFLPIKK